MLMFVYISLLSYIVFFIIVLRYFLQRVFGVFNKLLTYLLYCRRLSDRRLLLWTIRTVESILCKGLGCIQGGCGSNRISTRLRSVHFLQYVHFRAALKIFI